MYGQMDEELTVRGGKSATETGEQYETKIFLSLLQQFVICPGLISEREFATEIETDAQVPCTIKILLRTFLCEISVMHRTCASHPINIWVYNTVTALSTIFKTDTPQFWQPELWGMTIISKLNSFSTISYKLKTCRFSNLQGSGAGSIGQLFNKCL